jgi:hypothetical protein
MSSFHVKMEAIETYYWIIQLFFNNSFKHIIVFIAHKFVFLNKDL